MKATIRKANGTTIEIDGTPDEVASVIKAAGDEAAPVFIPWRTDQHPTPAPWEWTPGKFVFTSDATRWRIG